MRAILVLVVLTVATAGLARAQTVPEASRVVIELRSPRMLIERQQDMLRSLRVELAVRRVEIALGAKLTADQLTWDQGTVPLQGNVVISFANGMVVTADDAVIENGEIRVGANARVSLPQQ